MIAGTTEIVGSLLVTFGFDSIIAAIACSLEPASLGFGSVGRVGLERPVLFAALPVALTAVTVLFYWNPGAGAPRGRNRVLMIVSRVLIAILLITASAGPYLVNVDQSTGDPEVHLLVDDSASMDIYDTDPAAIADSIEAEGVPVRQTTVASGGSSPLGDEVLRSIETGSHVVLLSDGQVTTDGGWGRQSISPPNRMSLSVLSMWSRREQNVSSLSTPPRRRRSGPQSRFASPSAVSARRAQSSR